MLRSTLSSLREYLTPVSHTSTFLTKGEITPEEFVRAGDYLVYRFPTWSWGTAPPSKARSFLPPDKQFLVTKQVPCHQRATAVSGAPVTAQNEETDDDWVISGDHLTPAPDAVEADISGNLDEDWGLEEPGSEGQPAQINRNERSYNVYIAYSTSYRVPKLYLSGFDADGSPLPPKRMFDDIIGDYKDKTATIESAPFAENLTAVSIHPCKHASVMRLLLDKANAKAMEQQQSNDDEWEELDSGIRVDQYLVVFLKFVASVTPTIEHDFTMSSL